MKYGDNARSQLARFGQQWEQGEHILITGGTGLGKTELARALLQRRIDGDGFVVVFVGKLTPDKTITESYAKKDGWVRWTSWRQPNTFERKILLWPRTESPRLKTIPQKREHQRAVFEHAMDRLINIGHWTVQLDEGLYMTHPSFMRLSDHVAMLHAMGRSSNLSLMTLAQRPANLPPIIYSSATHAFTSRTTHYADVKRLAEMASGEEPKQTVLLLRSMRKYDFLWNFARNIDAPSEILNLAK